MLALMLTIRLIHSQKIMLASVMRIAGRDQTGIIFSVTTETSQMEMGVTRSAKLKMTSCAGGQQEVISAEENDLNS